MLRCNHRRNKNYPEYRWSNTCCSLQQEIIVYSQQPNKIAINYKENLALMTLPTSTCQVKIRMYRILFPTRMNNKKNCQQKAEKDKKKNVGIVFSNLAFFLSKLTKIFSSACENTKFYLQQSPTKQDQKQIRSRLLFLWKIFFKLTIKRESQTIFNSICFEFKILRWWVWRIVFIFKHSNSRKSILLIHL